SPGGAAVSATACGSACIADGDRLRRSPRGPYICPMSPAQGAGGRLVVCPTPIGNLEDVTLRVLRALREADVIACEDTRQTRKLLERHEIGGRLLVSYHEHNERRRARELVDRIGGGEVVALVSDAGTPGVSDP